MSTGKSPAACCPIRFAADTPQCTSPTWIEVWFGDRNPALSTTHFRRTRRRETRPAPPAGETYNYSVIDPNSLSLQNVNCVPGGVCVFNFVRVLF